MVIYYFVMRLPVCALQYAFESIAYGVCVGVGVGVCVCLLGLSPALPQLHSCALWLSG